MRSLWYNFPGLRELRMRLSGIFIALLPWGTFYTSSSYLIKILEFHRAAKRAECIRCFELPLHSTWGLDI